MRTFKVVFTGRLRDAIGLFYTIIETVQAPDPESAVSQLYAKYDHVSLPRVEEVR